MNNPLLSICIPTYNRANLLKSTLESIVSQPEFLHTNDVEIVISDNASTDQTPQIVHDFVTRYPGKIVALRQAENVNSSQNFYHVLTQAGGQFLKLNNDTLIWHKNTLAALLSAVKKHINDQTPLFFINQDKCPTKTVQGVDGLVAVASYQITWIGGFGIWAANQPVLMRFIEKEKTRLAQTDIVCELACRYGQTEIVGGELFHTQEPKRKGAANNDAYNIAEIFGHNYLQILKEYLSEGALSQRVYQREKKKILLKHINPYYFDVKKQFAFNQTGYFKWLWDDYKYCPYFYAGYVKMYIKKLKYRFKKLF